MLYWNFPILFFVKSYKIPIFALRYILKWSRRCLVLSYRRLLLPVASSYTVLTPVWNINVSTVSITECNATGKRNRFLFLLLTQFSYVKTPSPNHLSAIQKVYRLWTLWTYNFFLWGHKNDCHREYGLDRTAKLRDRQRKRGSDCRSNRSSSSVSYTHLTLPTTERV